MSSIVIDPAFNSVALAVAVLQDGVAAMSEEEKDIFQELLPLLLCDDEEERQSAVAALHELLNPSSGGIMPMPAGEANSRWLKLISSRIRSAREAVGMTQVELSEATGIPQSHLSRLEKGEHSPSAKTREKIAKILGVNPETMQRDGKPSKKSKKR